MNTDKNNKLIAEFIGYFPQDLISNDGYLGFWSTPNNKHFPNHNFNQIMFGAMKFYTSWDWIMLAIDKIETLNDNNFVIHSTFKSRRSVNIKAEHQRRFKNIDIYYSGKQTKIQATYNAVVQFIKWYNKSLKL